MKHVLDYRVSRDGKVWVHQEDGVTRKATEKEWLEIWQRDPSLTVKLTLH